MATRSEQIYAQNQSSHITERLDSNLPSLPHCTHNAFAGHIPRPNTMLMRSGVAPWARRLLSAAVPAPAAVARSRGVSDASLTHHVTQARKDTGQLSYACGTSLVPLSGATLGGALDHTVARFASRNALISPTQKVRWTYAELGSQVDQLAAGLLKMGLTRGDR